MHPTASRRVRPLSRRRSLGRCVLEAIEVEALQGQVLGVGCGGRASEAIEVEAIEVEAIEVEALRGQALGVGRRDRAGEA